MIYAGALYVIALFFLINSLMHIWKFRDMQRFIFGCILIVLCIMSFLCALYFSGHIVYLPALYGSLPFWSAIVHALLLYYFITTYTFEFKWTYKYGFLFVLTFLQAVLYIYKFFLGFGQLSSVVLEDMKLNRLSFFPDKIIFYFHCVSLILLYLFSIVFITYRFDIKKLLKTKRKKAIAVLLFMEVLALAIFYLNYSFVFHQFVHGFPRGYDAVAIFFLILIFFVLIQFSPYYLRNGYLPIDMHNLGVDKYFNNYLAGKDTTDISEKIRLLTKKDMFYRDEDINLKIFSEKLGLTSHQLSEYLNRIENKSFTTFINELRIADAKELLKSPEGRNIIEICYEVGFNTPSVFFNSFRRITGMSPRKWQEKLRNKSN